MISAIEATGHIKKYQVFTSITTILSLPVAYVALKYWHVSAEYTMVIYLFFTILTEVVRVGVVLPTINLSILCYIHRVVLYSIFPMGIIWIAYTMLPQCDSMTLFQLVYYSVIVVLGVITVIYIFGISRTERVMVNMAVRKLCQMFKKSVVD